MSDLQVELGWTMHQPNLISSLFGMTDEQAMVRVQTAEDHRAFAKLVERWERPILRLCAKMTGDLHRAEDLKQATFERVFIKRQDYRAPSKFSTWLWRIALNLCYDEIRRTQRRAKLMGESQNPEMLEFPDQRETPYLRLVQHEEEEIVRAALQRLDETVRTVVILRYCEGLKLREISEVLDLPESTISSRVAVGLSRLTRLLEPAFAQTHLEASKPKSSNSE